MVLQPFPDITLNGADPPGTGQKYLSTAPLTYRGEWSADELKAAEHAITVASGDLRFEHLRNARVSRGLRVLRVATVTPVRGWDMK